MLQLIGFGIAGFVAVCLAVLLAGRLLSWAGDIYRAYFSTKERARRERMREYVEWRRAHPKAAKAADEHFGILEELESSE